VFLPVPPEMKVALDLVPVPLRNADSRYFFWDGIGKPKTHKAHVDRALRTLFKAAGVASAHAHRFRHTLATELLGRGASFEEVADILGNGPEVVRKHYGKWSAARQTRIDDLMNRVFIPLKNSPARTDLGANWHTPKLRPQTTEKKQDIWRRKRDSNPREPFDSNGFQDRRIQPLCHSSVYYLT
jgi:hypothetical protein